MANEGSDQSQADAVAMVASRLFGEDIKADAVIGETLRRATSESVQVKDLGDKLIAAVREPLPDVLTDDILKEHPLSIWIELAIGLQLQSPAQQRTMATHRLALGRNGLPDKSILLLSWFPS